MNVRLNWFALFSADITAMQVSQFYKDPGEQARYKFERGIFMNVRIVVLFTYKIVQMKMSQF